MAIRKREKMKQLSKKRYTRNNCVLQKAMYALSFKSDGWTLRMVCLTTTYWKHGSTREEYQDRDEYFSEIDVFYVS